MSVVPGSQEPTRPGVKLTYDDFVHFPDDGMRHELIDGAHYVTPAPNRRHQVIVGNIHALLWTHMRSHPDGQVFVAPFDVLFSRFDVVEPDVLFVSGARARVVTEKNVRGTPDLVVEVGSPTTRRRDERLKRELHERSGVSEYWIVDPDLDLIKVFRLVEGRYAAPLELPLERGDVLTTPLLPGFALPLAEVFRDPSGAGA